MTWNSGPTRRRTRSMCARPRAWAAETWASTASASRRCGRRWIQRSKGAPRCRLSAMPIKKILIADDSSTARHVLFQMLARHGYRCILAETAREAMDKAKTENPDLILLDVVMPDMSGFELTRIITRDEATKHIPVILCTSKSHETDRLWGLRQGATNYVVKPVVEDDLLAKITALG